MEEKKLSNNDCSCCSDCNDDVEGCACGTECCTPSNDESNEKKQIVLDYLFCDLSVCTRCKGTDTSVEDAIRDIESLTGINVKLNKIHVATQEQAIQYKFVSSPTIRVNGKDIQVELKEDNCESCGELCGDEMDCRLWTYQGKTYTVAPKAMIVDAMLKAVYGGNHTSESDQEYSIPDNLKKFFILMESKASNPSMKCC